LVIPLVSRRNLLYSLALFASDPDDKALTVPGRHTHEALVLATHFHQIARDLIDGAGGTRPSQLTPRERECLLWAACGKTAWETAHILNISERTVKFHLGNANRRLDTSNTTHAVARAIVRGEFLP
jgi:DNA-binding CsgD family transcriptional regulator